MTADACPGCGCAAHIGFCDTCGCLDNRTAESSGFLVAPRGDGDPALDLDLRSSAAQRNARRFDGPPVEPDPPIVYREEPARPAAPASTASTLRELLDEQLARAVAMVVAIDPATPPVDQPLPPLATYYVDEDGTIRAHVPDRPHGTAGGPWLNADDFIARCLDQEVACHVRQSARMRWHTELLDRAVRRPAHEPDLATLAAEAASLDRLGYGWMFDPPVQRRGVWLPDMAAQHADDAERATASQERWRALFEQVNRDVDMAWWPSGGAVTGFLSDVTDPPPIPEG